MFGSKKFTITEDAFNVFRDAVADSIAELQREIERINRTVASMSRVSIEGTMEDVQVLQRRLAVTEAETLDLQRKTDALAEGVGLIFEEGEDGYLVATPEPWDEEVADAE